MPLEASQHVGERSRGRVADGEGDERFVVLAVRVFPLRLSFLLLLLLLLLSGCSYGWQGSRGISLAEDEEARGVVVPVLDASRQDVQAERRGGDLARHGGACPCGVGGGQLGRAAGAAHLDAFDPGEVFAEKRAGLAKGLGVGVDAADVG